ncbi:MAG TPA: hypothetical protein VK978_03740 [Candidatus Saccharimonadales bacterium]|nr:hypothetical protein [Candidatus Saccharimonadales bacterium]
MDEAIIADFKQFIAATVTQATSDIRGDITAINHRMDNMDQRFDNMDQRFDGMDQRFDTMDQRFDDLELKLNTLADAHAETLSNHEKRLEISSSIPSKENHSCLLQTPGRRHSAGAGQLAA